MTSITISNDHVALLLLQDDQSPFYLQIPSNSIQSLCLKPLKYLLFLGWCILGVNGKLLDEDDKLLDPDGDLVDGEIYYYDIIDEDFSLQDVDLEVIKTRITVPSQTTEIREDFGTKLLERDASCVWTGTVTYGRGLHIIPHRRGSDWLQLIVENRPHHNENVEDLDEINDIRNGVFAICLIRDGFDAREAVILKTPNKYLQPEDIPPRHDRRLPSNAIYPPHDRYTLQWIKPDKRIVHMIPNNCDAVFKKRSRKPKPSDLLLHYSYGAAAIKMWGHGMDVFDRLFKPPHPSRPVPTPSGPSNNVHDRATTVHKLDKARDRGTTGKHGESSTRFSRTSPGK